VTRTLFSLRNLAALALCVAALVNLAAPSLTRAAVCGDVNGDGVVNIGDALVVAQYDVGLRTCGVAPFSHPEVCDVNGDAACDIGDALRMAQCDVGLIGCAFTCGSFACSSTTTTTTTTSTSSTTTTTTAPPACHFPATGQTTCWDSSGNVIPCAGTGQDGDLQKGAPLSYTDNGDGTITDNNTGLMWEKLSMDGSVHDVSNTYTWANAFAQHVATLNGTSFAGHTDWRVPNVKELQNIVPAVSPAFNNNCTSGCTVLTCSCTTSSSGYWSSTTVAGQARPGDPPGPTFAWFVLFDEGNVQGADKSEVNFVRGVRGGSSCFPATGQTTCWDSSGNVIPCAGTGQDGDLQKGAPLSYTDNGDGTITDNNTGLMWEKLSMDGSVHDVSNTYTWANAFAQHVATLNGTSFAGHTDWRMPNVKELESIMNYQNVDPTVSPAFNTNCTSGCTVLTCSCTTSSSGYWSSTTAASNPSTAGVLDTGGGGVCLDSKSFLDNVRGVRGGS